MPLNFPFLYCCLFNQSLNCALTCLLPSFTLFFLPAPGQPHTGTWPCGQPGPPPLPPARFSGSTTALERCCLRRSPGEPWWPRSAWRRSQSSGHIAPFSPSHLAPRVSPPSPVLPQGPGSSSRQPHTRHVPIALASLTCPCGVPGALYPGPLLCLQVLSTA